MPKQQLLESLISGIPENKLDIIIENPLLSEPSLAKDWLLKEEDSAWENL